MVYLPQDTSPGRRWVLHDYRHRVISTPPAADGVTELEFEQVPQDELWLVDRVIVQSTSSAATVAHLYLDAIDDRHVLDGTRVGNFDVADNNSPIQLLGSSVLRVRWQGADDGAVGTCRIQLVVLRQVS